MEADAEGNSRFASVDSEHEIIQPLIDGLTQGQRDETWPGMLRLS
ncbi:hypothetical protein [Nocardia goodfellowii]|uniref:Uncharacterized protein n=1 Tax=Nocardia goodfellowii TaxID=882446 RepID=A0ABS4QGX3_9NOCA|nr:hypothetical protein [Nocardia goodfellowii]MBP2190954.1 hypothetical protein [Nocardia goodfellowii]